MVMVVVMVMVVMVVVEYNGGPPYTWSASLSRQVATQNDKPAAIGGKVFCKANTKSNWAPN